LFRRIGHTWMPSFAENPSIDLQRSFGGLLASAHSGRIRILVRDSSSKARESVAGAEVVSRISRLRIVKLRGVGEIGCRYLIAQRRAPVGLLTGAPKSFAIRSASCKGASAPFRSPAPECALPNSNSVAIRDLYCDCGWNVRDSVNIGSAFLVRS